MRAKLGIPARLSLSLCRCCRVLRPCASPAAALLLHYPFCHLTPGSCVLLPLPASHLHSCCSSPASAPSLLLPSVQPGQPNPQAAAWCGSSLAQGALAPLGHCCSTNAPSHPKGCCGGCILCSWMPCTTESCRCLHPLARLCLCQQLPEELTHFWLQQVPLALLSLCLSLIFDV